MADPLNDSARSAAAEIITQKRDALVEERTALLERRSDLLARLRRIDRELADCRAAARLFDLNIVFPPDEREEMEAARERERQLLRSHQFELEQKLSREIAAARNAAIHRMAEVQKPAPLVVAPPPAIAPPVSQTAPSAPRPPLREILLEQLKIAGTKGSKAATLRDYVERTFGMVTHEKTIGMTLYRLSQEKGKPVRRDGHIWFFNSASAEKKNPGVSAPGPVNVFD